ncbi:MAG: hypothetical protein V3U33_07390, partial [candidate division NC10 bacterium]
LPQGIVQVAAKGGGKLRVAHSSPFTVHGSRFMVQGLRFRVLPCWQLTADGWLLFSGRRTSARSSAEAHSKPSVESSSVVGRRAELV